MMTGRQIRYQYAQFTPSEVASITGISTSKQLDWRRYKFLPPNEKGKHARFSLQDLADVAMLAEFTSMDLPIKTARMATNLAVLPLIAWLVAVDWQARGVSRDIAFPIGFDGARYVYIFDGARVGRCNSLSDLESIINSNPGKFPSGFIIVDCHALAIRIQSRAGKPLCEVVIS